MSRHPWVSCHHALGCVVLLSLCCVPSMLYCCAPLCVAHPHALCHLCTSVCHVVVVCWCNHVLRHVTLPLPCHVPSGVVLPCAAAHFHVSHCPWVLCCQCARACRVMPPRAGVCCIAIVMPCPPQVLYCCTPLCVACPHVLCHCMLPRVVLSSGVVLPHAGVCLYHHVLGCSDVAITVPCPPQVLYCCALQHVAVPSRCHITITCQAPVILPYIVLYPGRVLLASPRVGMGGEAETTKVTYLLVWK